MCSGMNLSGIPPTVPTQDQATKENLQQYSSNFPSGLKCESGVRAIVVSPHEFDKKSIKAQQ